MPDLAELDAIVETIMEALEGQNAARETALTQTRKLIRHCSTAIRAIHRHHWDEARAELATATQLRTALAEVLADYPDIYYSGLTQDALKEFAEAHLTYAIIQDQLLPTHQDLNIEPAIYMNGLAEAATELRRHILDLIRHHHNTDAERLLAAMDAIYSQLITVDFTDAITKGLRHRTDVVRNVLEKTRGDITTSFRQQQLQNALDTLETSMGIHSKGDNV